MTKLLHFFRSALFSPASLAGSAQSSLRRGRNQTPPPPLHAVMGSSNIISALSRLRLLLPKITKVAQKTQKFSFFILVVFAVLISGCGYTIHSGVRSDIATINIATFENRTFEHGLEAELSKVLTKEFILDGAFSVVDVSEADVQLSGEIVEYVLEPYTYGVDESEVEQYRVRIQASVSLRQVGGKEAMWEELMEGDATYYLSGALARTEEEASRLALYELAKKIVSRTVRAW